MIKDDTKEQISLFELPQPEKPAEKQAQPKAETETKTATEEKVAKAGTEGGEKPAPQKEPPIRMETAKPAAKLAKRKQAQKPALQEKPAKAVPGAVPEGDVRLTANIRQDLHLKLKIAAATRRTTIGELIEELVEKYL